MTVSVFITASAFVTVSVTLRATVTCTTLGTVGNKYYQVPYTGKYYYTNVPYIETEW